MRRPRLWAGALLGVAVAVGTAADERPSRAVPRSGEYWILAGDFHVHAGPGDGTLLPWDLRTEARRAGLDVIAATNHNTTLAGRLAEWWGRQFPRDAPIVIAGEEITSPDYHLAAVGVRETVSPWQPAASAIDAIHAQGGVAIAAHPAREYWPGYPEAALSRLDGAEVANDPRPIPRADAAAFMRRALALNADVAAIGSSDFHGWSKMGNSRTYLFVRERSASGVLDAIRNGRTVAESEDGTLLGPADLVRAVQANRPAGRSDGNRGWRWLSLACAWIGVLGLLFLRSSR